MLLKQQLEKEKNKLATATTAAEKAKYKASIDDLTTRADKLAERFTCKSQC